MESLTSDEIKELIETSAMRYSRVDYHTIEAPLLGHYTLRVVRDPYDYVSLTITYNYDGKVVYATGSREYSWVKDLFTRLSAMIPYDPATSAPGAFARAVRLAIANNAYRKRRNG